MNVDFELTGEPERMAELVGDRLKEDNPDADVDLSEQAKAVFVSEYLMPQYQQIVREETMNGSEQ